MFWSRRSPSQPAPTIPANFIYLTPTYSGDSSLLQGQVKRCTVDPRSCLCLSLGAGNLHFFVSFSRCETSKHLSSSSPDSQGVVGCKIRYRQRLPHLFAMAACAGCPESAQNRILTKESLLASENRLFEYVCQSNRDVTHPHDQTLARRREQDIHGRDDYRDPSRTAAQKVQDFAL